MLEVAALPDAQVALDARAGTVVNETRAASCTDAATAAAAHAEDERDAEEDELAECCCAQPESKNEQRE